MYRPLIIAALLTPSMLIAGESEPVAGEFKDSYLIFNSEDGEYQFKLDGRIMLDFGVVNSDKNPNLVADTDFRRLRLAFKTKFYDVWTAEFDVDFEGNEVDTKDMWLAYTGIPDWNFKIGHHKPNFSIAEVTTSRWYTFMEVPTPVEMFAPGRRIGFSANHWKTGYFAGFSLFGDEADVNASDFEDDDDGVSERYGYTARFALRPLSFDNDNDRNVFHVALNYLNDKPMSEDEREYRYRSRLESKVADYRFLNTGKMGDVDDVTVTGLELLYLNNNWFIQSEYLKSEVAFTNGEPNYDADGYYIQASYFLWGEGRRYGFSDGELGAVRPAKGSSDLEFALRYSSSDLDDAAAGVLGGTADITTLGVNWYANTNVLFRLNYIMADVGVNADGDGDFVGDDSINMLTARIQVMF